MKKHVCAWVAANRLLAASLGVSAAVAVVVVVVVPLALGSWLTGTGPGEETGSTTVRNLGILFAALAALPLAVWRAQVADQQAKAADRQADTAQADLRNERFQDGAAMLGSEVLAVRLAGIYALQRLAEDHPEEHHVEVMKTLCAFVRHPTVDSRANGDKVRADVQGAMGAISACHGRQLRLEDEREFRLDLRGADLTGVLLLGANLSQNTDFSIARLDSAYLGGASLAGADFTAAILQGADFTGADLSNATFEHANLEGVNFEYATLSGVLFAPPFTPPETLADGSARGSAIGLIQGQLDHASADPDKSPHLEGVFDAKTGEQLVWRGRERTRRPPPPPPPPTDPR